MKRMIDKAKRSDSSASGGGGGGGARSSRGLRTSGAFSASPRHSGQVASKFQFDLIIEAVHGVTNPGNYAVKWTRGVKVATTKPKPYTPPSASTSRAPPPMAVSQKLTLLCTLYRASPTSPFEEKDAKLSLVSYPGRGEKSLAKVHFNLAEFAGVPSATSKKVLDLTGGRYKIAVTILASYMGTGGRKGAGSVSGSSLSGLSMASSASGASVSTADDLSDLSEEMAPISSVPKTTSRSSGGGATIRMPQTQAPPQKPSSNGVSSARSSTSQAASNPEIAALKQRLADAERSMQQYQKRTLEAEQKASELKVMQNTAPMAPRADSGDSKAVLRLTRELETLRSERDAAQRELSQAKQQRDAALKSDSSAALASLQKSQQDLIDENNTLRKNNEELLSQIDDMELDRERLETHLIRSTSSASGGGSSAASAAELESMKKKVSAKDAEINLLNRKVLDLQKASVAQRDVGGDSDMKNKYAKLESEHAAAQAKIKSHESHSAKMKKTYQELSEMYSKMRTDYMTIQSKYKKKSQQLVEAQAGNSSVSSDTGQELSEAIARETKAKEDLEVVTSKKVELEKKLMDQGQRVSQLEAEVASFEKKESRSGSLKAEMTEELEKSQNELKQALDLVEKLRDEADSSFQEFSEAKRELERRCAEIKEERDSTASEVERLRKRRGMETETLKKDLERNAEEMDRLRKKKNDEIERLGEERDNAVQQLDRLKREHERRLQELEDEIDSRGASEDAEQKLKTLEVQLTAARSREQNLDDELTKLRTAYERKVEQLKDAEEHVKQERSRSLSLAAATGGPTTTGAGLDEEVVHQLIESKLKLADAEEEILKYKNIVRKFKDGKHKQVLERIAEHASNLEVKLSEAQAELAKYRSTDPNRSFMKLPETNTM